MRRKVVVLVVSLILAMPLFAQLEVRKGSFKEVPGFVNLNSDPNYQFDDNDLPFAVIKVRTENITDKQRRQLNFSGNLATFIMLEYKDGEVWVYLTAKYADYLKVSHPDFSSTEFTLPFDLKPKCGYEMLLVNKTKNETGSGSLTINTKPENGATITLNGTLINQNTPYVNDMMAAGTYEVTVSKERYQSVTKTIKVKNGSKQELIIEMPLDVAEITIQADVLTDVYIDGFLRRKGTWIGELKSGSHEVELRKQNHKPARKTIMVVAGKAETILLNPTPINGNLTVKSEPSGATVYIDNNYYGETPLTLNSVMIGEHDLVVEKSGFISSTKTITLEENYTLSLNEKLPVGLTNKIFTVDGVSFEMVAVEGGSFNMGAQHTNYKGINYDPEAQNDEGPVHEVTLSDYYIGKYEVTQELWTVVMERNPEHFKGDNYPVERVSWYDALRFCNRLSEKCGRLPCYLQDRKGKITIDPKANGFRLPTEAEWEYAAKGGNKSKGYKYSGSNDVYEVAWYARNSGNGYIHGSLYDASYDSYSIVYDHKCTTHLVGKKKPNELGIYDMSGNVIEWCNDWYEKYNNGKQINPVGATKGTERTLRGGGWYFDAHPITHRYSCKPNSLRVQVSSDYNWREGHGIGFRIVTNR